MNKLIFNVNEVCHMFVNIEQLDQSVDWQVEEQIRKAMKKKRLHQAETFYGVMFYNAPKDETIRDNYYREIFDMNKNDMPFMLRALKISSDQLRFYQIPETICLSEYFDIIAKNNYKKIIEIYLQDQSRENCQLIHNIYLGRHSENFSSISPEISYSHIYDQLVELYHQHSDEMWQFAQQSMRTLFNYVFFFHQFMTDEQIKEFFDIFTSNDITFANQSAIINYIINEVIKDKDII